MVGIFALSPGPIDWLISISSTCANMSLLRCEGFTTSNQYGSTQLECTARELFVSQQRKMWNVMHSMNSMYVRGSKSTAYNFAFGSSGLSMRSSPARAAPGIAIAFRVLGSTYTCTKSTTAQALGSLGSLDLESCWTNIPTRYVTDDFPSFETTRPNSRVSAKRLAASSSAVITK